jgi:uncharacterized protein YndB with AHSA1/START domain
LGEVRVVGAGFGRTGTLSLKVALEALGYGPCYHMTEMVAHPERSGLWLAACRGEAVDWGEALAGYGATVDWPGSAFYGEILEANPAAKVVLTVRDPEDWYESVSRTLYSTHRAARGGSWLAAAVAAATELVSPGSLLPLRVAEEVVWSGTFGGRFADRDYAIGVYERHVREVRERVDGSRLLVYDVREGWGPLCAFLGAAPPQGLPFPRLNDRADYRRMVRASVLRNLGWPVGDAGRGRRVLEGRREAA